MTVVIGIVTGVLTGVASAALFWWWQAKLMRPKLILCPTIARYRLPDDKVDRYQIKINNGRRRLAIDLKVTVSIHLPDLVRTGSTETVTLHKSENPSLNINVRHRIQPGRMPQDTKDRYLSYLPPHLAKSIRHGETVDLGEFFTLRFIQVHFWLSVLQQLTHSLAQAASCRASTTPIQSRLADLLAAGVASTQAS